MYLKRYNKDYQYTTEEVERIRTIIRYYMGANGDKMRSSQKFTPTNHGSGITQPSMPESECVERKPFLIRLSISSSRGDSLDFKRSVFLI